MEIKTPSDLLHRSQLRIFRCSLQYPSTNQLLGQYLEIKGPSFLVQSYAQRGLCVEKKVFASPSVDHKIG